MDVQQIRQLAETGTSLAVFGGVVFGWVKWIWPALKRLGSIIACAWARVKAVWKSLEELPSLTTSFGGMNEAFDTLKGQVNLVNGIIIQVKESATVTLPGQIGELSKQSEQRSRELAQHGEQIYGIAKKVDGITNDLRAAKNTNPRLATFETDANGDCVDVNRTYLKWTGLTLAEVTGKGWLNAIHPSDLARVRAAWESAVADSRRFADRYRMVNSADGSVFEVDGTAEPIPEGVRPAERWTGTLYKVQART